MNSPAFLARPSCEVCGCNDRDTVLSKPFTDPAVLQFLNDYYGEAMSGPLLKSAPFEISKCRSCGFLWQQFILNDPGMSLLYGQWIDPDKSREKRAASELTLFKTYAREMMYIAMLT